MQRLRNFVTAVPIGDGAPLVLPFLVLAVEASWWLGWGRSAASVLTQSSGPSSSNSTIGTKMLFSISSLIVAASLSAVLLRYEKWVKSSRHAERYYAPIKSLFLIVSGTALVLGLMLLAAWKTPTWSLAFQVTVWLLLCSAAFELSPERISTLLEQAANYRRRSVKELAILAYSRRFGCAVIGLLCIEVGAWLIYLMTHESVVNYAEALAAFFVVTLAMYLLLYIPSCWGAIFLVNGTKRRQQSGC